jgi:hypothetical protein
VIPLYGFLEGDTIGLIVLADENDTMSSLARKLGSAASVRVANGGERVVEVHGRVVAGTITVRQVGLAALDRFDVRERRS